ncbi:MAG: hypothetical protein ACYTFT_13140 [Planctomycetota bacterium]|jgi:GNAT superfamily N-acetyltransferase
MRVEAFDLGDELLAAFLDLGICAREPGTFCPPLRANLERELSEANPFLAHGSLRLFLAFEGDRAVARAAGIVDRRLEHEGVPAGMIGFFEAIDPLDRFAVTEAVLNAASVWLKEQGARVALGPMDFSIFHRYRFMTKGFETLPFLGEPRNPESYPEAFTRYGFTPCARYFSWDLLTPHLRGMEQFANAAAGPALLEAGYRTRPIDRERFDEDLRALHALVVPGFQSNVGSIPLSFEEFQAVFGPGLSFLIPELSPVLEAPDGSVAGLGYIYPDYAHTLIGTDGGAEAMGAFLTAAATADTQRFVLHTMVLAPNHRKRGLIETCLGPVLTAARKLGLDHAVGALTKEGPTIYHKTGAPSREYTLYQRAL